MIERPSPNFGPRPKDAVIDMLVVHYTGMVSAEEALERLGDPDARGQRALCSVFIRRASDVAQMAQLLC